MDEESIEPENTLKAEIAKQKKENEMRSKLEKQLHDRQEDKKVSSSKKLLQISNKVCYHSLKYRTQRPKF